MKHTVVLLRSVRTAKGWERRRVTPGKHRNWEQRMDADPQFFGADVLDLGAYQIRRVENRKTQYEPGGDTYAQAAAVFQSRVAQMNLGRAARLAGAPLPAAAPQAKAPLLEQMEIFLAARQAKGRHTAEETRESYRRAVTEFIGVTGARHSKDVTPAVLVAYLAGLRRRGLHAQTIAGRYIAVSAVLRFTDKALIDLLSEYRPPAPRHAKSSYSAEDAARFLAFLNARPRQYGRLALIAEMYLKTGLRNKELAYLTWDVIDLKAGFIRKLDNREVTLRVRGRVRKETFRTKARRDRELGIPLSDGLLGRLKTWRESHPHDRFVFPTANGNPDFSLRTKIRTAICHAGLNCGACDACLAPCGRCRHCRCNRCDACAKRLKCRQAAPGKQPCTRLECRQWSIHKFRHSFVTLALHNGADPGTVKDIAGHADLRTTNGYLSTIAEGKAREKINQVFASAFGD
jgi:integrase